MASAKKLSIQLNLNPNEGGNSSIVVYHQGNTYSADSNHPAWDSILDRALADDESAVELFDIAAAVGKRVSLSRRVSIAKGYIFVDGEELRTSLTDFIVRTIEDGNDATPFVTLLEKVLQNPNDHSREQLYDFIDRHKITITPDGDLVLYKSVYSQGDGSYTSVNVGPAIINGEPHKDGRVPQKDGDTVEMARSEVVHDPSTGCSFGLHVGSYAYASRFSGDTVLEVLVHPADVVSVPISDSKIRTCRYQVVGKCSGEYKESVRSEPAPEQPATDALAVEADVKHPSASAFAKAKIKAKKAKKGFARYATERQHWTLVDGDGSHRKHWSVG